MQKPLLFASALLLGAATAAPALAQGAGPGPRGTRMLDAIFVKLDANKDGKVTKEEIDTYRLAQFKAADKNNDGFLEGEEIRVFVANRRFSMRDADGDGKLSATEFGARRADRFKEIDKNNDGFVTPDELKAARDAAREARMKRLQQPGERDRARGRDGDRARDARDGERRKFRRHAWRRGGMWIMRLDLNKDGRISLAEYNLQGDRMFLAFDLNTDGSITKIEMRQRMAMGFGPRWKKGNRHHRGMRHHGKRHHAWGHHGHGGDRMHRGHGGRPN